MDQLQTIVLAGQGVGKENKPYYQSAYNLWRMVWKQTLLELDGSSELYSDHFSRQDFIVCVFHRNDCVGLTCFRRADLSMEAHREDSWFKPWPQKTLIDIGAEYTKGLAISWVSIHPDYRKTGKEGLKDLDINPRLAEMMNFFMLDCKPMEMAFGVTRNNRGIDKFGAYIGSETVQHDAKLHGVSVDLITFVPEGLQKAQSAYPLFSHKMWSERIVCLGEKFEVTAPSKSRLKKSG